jgi:hypothetical protein
MWWRGKRSREYATKSAGSELVGMPAKAFRASNILQSLHAPTLKEEGWESGTKHAILGDKV